ncbi:glutathione synthase [Brucella intermedia]|nr:MULTISPECIES: glutathione synthase [Brucella/Ochrobactrum group]PJR90797.1 glutathione synthase [Ochrobactrum sp. 721/2009]PJT15917.1 glutathione synthase [Ochrobactrum sp. 720/2009]PJT19664.1 glutathione synthase [Ochrobactrum sp. 30A/1000/2015]PJT25737.1 glutathione synthase [Ochrobactrum sp. 715/2009]PJT29343.1 glutathione synthase [Ochrobactrum sp. 695/2009]PJT35258.1 glutathione synthase [Ochrobactrum sp. 689/2009]PJT40669.1 glutathione synthase [Ochrobactrum sp. 27A/999/2015]PJT450
MALKVAVQMDHISTVNIAGDTTFALSLEAQKRGHELYHYTPDRLSMRDGVVSARLEKMEVRDIKGDHYTLGEPIRRDLSEMDVVLLRQDPPFDMNYITTTHLLERIHPKTLVVNDPAWVRNSPEKIFVTEFPDLMPETLITKDPQEVMDFRREFGDIILKPLYGNGGAGVFHLADGDRNLTSLLEMFGQLFKEPFIAQRYLKDVRAGDKRIILIDGEPVGAINRVPSETDARSNMHVGGRAEQSKLTPREREICERIGPSLKERGFILVGIDVIGDYMTEINVTSPTGIREIQRFDGTNIAALFWDAVEAKR